METYVKGQLYNIMLSDLHPDPNQPRKFMEPAALEELTASIKQHGVLEPILFRVGDSTPNTQNSTPSLIVVAGERRFAAAQNAGLTSIPAIFIEGNHAEIALVENLLRQDLTAVEEAEAFQRLMTEQNYTQEQLGTIIGKAQNTLSEILSLNKLPQEIRDECRGDRTISKNTLITISKKKQARSMLTAYKTYKEKLAKQQETAKPSTKKTAQSQVLVELLNKTNERFEDLDTSNFTEDEKTQIATAMTQLKATITTTLKSITRKQPTNV